MSIIDYILIIVLLIICSISGINAGIEHERQNAIKAGAAEYITDKQTGTLQFIYSAKK